MRSWIFLLCFTLFLESCRKPQPEGKNQELEKKTKGKQFKDFTTTHSFLARIPKDSELLYISSDDFLGLNKFLDIPQHKTLLAFGSIDSQCYQSSSKLWQHWLQAKAVAEVRRWRKSLNEPDVKLSWQEPFLEFLSSRQGSEELANFSLPPILLAFQESNPEKRSDTLNKVTQKLESLKSNLPTRSDLMLPVESSIFEGFEVNIIEALKSLGVTLQLDLLNEQRRSRLQQTLSKKKLVLLCGELDNNVVIFAGSSPSQLQLTDNKKANIMKHEAFLPFKTKKHSNIQALTFFSKDLLSSLKKHAHIAKSISKGLRTGLNETNSISNTTQLERALDNLQDRESDMLERYEVSDFAAIFKGSNPNIIDAYGGYHIPLFSLEKKHSFSLPEKAQESPFSLQANLEAEGFLHAIRWLSSIKFCSRELESLAEAHGFLLKNNLIQKVISSPFTAMANKISEPILPYLGSEISLIATEKASTKQGAIRMEHNNAAALQESIKELYNQRSSPDQQKELHQENIQPPRYKVSKEHNHIVWSDSLDNDTQHFALDANTITIASDKQLLDSFLNQTNESNSQGVSIQLKTQLIPYLPFLPRELSVKITKSAIGPNLTIMLQN